MIWTIIVVLVILWLFGLVVDIGSNLVHILLVGALIALVYNLLTDRREV